MNDELVEAFSERCTINFGEHVEKEIVESSDPLVTKVAVKEKMKLMYRQGFNLPNER